MPIQVKNEINPLKKVMLHRPGKELEHLVPDSLDRLLFDDIPFLQTAQQEHDQFAQALRDNGVEVVYLEDLVTQSLETSPQVRDQFISDFIDRSGDVPKMYKKELTTLLKSISCAKDLVQKTMSGIMMEEITTAQKHPLVELMQRSETFITDPIPNLYFTRDPFACVGNGVSMNHMYSVTRNRETLYGEYIFKYHPEYGNTVPLYYTPDEKFSIEGGDILNLSETVVAVGISQRTQAEGIERFAMNLFNSEQSKVRVVLALEIPHTRAFMHLDTVFTQIDVDKFTVHPGILQTLRTFEITSDEIGGLNVKEIFADLDILLAHYLGLERVTLIRCGGHNSIVAEREQWNDGSNTLCIAPGKVVVYDRNRVTNKLLEDQGIEVIRIPSSELSRGRGGPRCMSMPLAREYESF